MALRTEILPPRRAPKVTAGFKCPPETCALAAIAANRAKA